MKTFKEYVESVADTWENHRNPSDGSSRIIDGVTSLELIVGNPAGDADSIISALTLAYLDTEHQEQSNDTNSRHRVVLPLISIPQNDLALRRETVLLLQDMLQIEQSTLDRLPYIDSKGIDTLLPNANDDDAAAAASVDSDHQRAVPQWTLVDHNKLVLHSDHCIPRGWMEQSNVVRILDHHMDECCHLDTVGQDNEQRVIAFEDNKAIVASTCILVAERLLSFADETDASIPADVALALVVVMLLDSINMLPSAGKVTPRDKETIHKLLKNTDWGTLKKANSNIPFVDGGGEGSKDIQIDTDRVFGILSQSKTDLAFWKDLSVRDALRLDYKQFTTPGGHDVFGAASVLLPLDDFRAKPNLVHEVEKYMDECGIPLLVVMSMVMTEDGAPQRSMLVTGPQDQCELIDSMTEHLLQDETLQSTEVELTDGDDPTTTSIIIRQLVQANPRASRKQVVPVMMGFYDKIQ